MSTALFDLSGRRALITGAGQGIGLSLAEGLAAAGAEVVLNGRDPGKLERAAAALAGKGAAVATAAFDVSDAGAVNAAIERLVAETGPLDILINNAGIQRRTPLEDFAEADWRAVMRTNLDGVFLVSQAVVRHMIARQSGKIINVCSVMSEVGRPTVAPYTAAKGAVKMLTKGMCADWARYNIQVNGIGPGYFATEMNQGLIADAAFDAWVRQRTPAGRWGEVEELRGAAIFLASRASDYVNGQVLYVDGGLLSVL